MNKILIGCLIIATIALLGAGATLMAESSPGVPREFTTHTEQGSLCPATGCNNDGCTPGFPPC